MTGRIASVELPQGGTITYSYTGGNHGIECADGSAAGLTRTLTSQAGSAESTWTYARTTSRNNSQTSVEDGLSPSNKKTYNFILAAGALPSGPARYYETSRTIYQGAANGTPVLARTTCYNGSGTATPCTSTAFSLPISEIDTYETLNGIETHGSTVKYSTYGAQTENDMYDFASGTTSRGNLLRKETWTYGGPFANLPTLDEVFDGTGTTVAGEIQYAYDGGSVTASSGVPQNVAVTGLRGNLTSETLFATGNTSYKLSATYEDTGSIVTSSAPTGTTTISYDPTFVYSTGASFPTPSSGVAIGTGFSFDTTYTGLPLTSVDPNSQTTTAHSYDSMLRLTEVDSPDRGKTNWTYTPNPATMTTTIAQSSTVNSVSEVQYDGYGRLSRSTVSNGQSTNPFYQQDVCYDGNGNACFISYQYQGTGLGAGKVCSISGDTYTYDVLGLVTKIAWQTGETVTYAYLGRATKITDENLVKRIVQIDGLGRNTIVCEISSNSLPGSGTPASCGTDIACTGYATTYAYTLATGTTTVTQGKQTRTFVTDWLGRTISVTEPESGTTTYSYAYNSTGLVVTRTRPTANQTNASVTTTTTT